MKKLYYSILTAAVIPVFSMCSKEADQSETPVVGNLDIIEASVVPQEEKVSFTQESSKLALKWEVDDQIMVSGATDEVYTIDNSTIEDHKAVFSGEKVNPKGGKFDVWYPAEYSTIEALLSRSYAGQVQDGNGSTAHLEYNALISQTDDYHKLVFNKEGDNKLNGVLKLVVKMPDEVSEVSSISLSAPSDIFYTTNDADDTKKTNTLSLSFTEGTTVTDHVLTAYIMTSMQDVTIAAGTKLTITVAIPESASYFAKTLSNADAISINGGQTLNLDISTATVMTRKLAGEGTQASPYQIYNKYDMQAVKAHLAKKNSDEDATYFKLMNDVDMDNEGLSPLANGSKFYKIDFTSDGAPATRYTLSNVTINDPSERYVSIFGALNGSVHDVNFDGIQVTTTKYELAAVICAYLGGASETVVGNVSNVTVSNSSVSMTLGKDAPAVGIVCGNFARGKIDGVVVEGTCTAAQKITTSFDVSKSTKNAALGGIAGYTSRAIPSGQEYSIKNTECHAHVDLQSEVSPVDGDASKQLTSCGGILGMSIITGIIIDNCTFDGSLTTVSNINNYHFGGIVGLDKSAGLSISNCTNETNFDLTQHYTGGILGRSTGSNLVISKCTNNGKIKSTKNYICGIVGDAGAGSTITECENHATIQGGGYCTGIVGNIGDNAIIKSCSNDSAITGSANYCSGIVGRMTTTSTSDPQPFYNNHNTGSVNAGNYIGGVIGQATGAVSIDGCSNNGAVTAGASVGGIAGRLDGTNSSISNCENKASGTISTSSANVGGICGVVQGTTVSSCSNKASVGGTGGGTKGGIIGSASNTHTISNCSNTGSVSGTGSIGGVIGSSTSGTLSANSNTGDITGTTTYIGGIAGTATSGSVEQCFNTGDVSANESAGGIVGYLVSSSVSNCYSKSGIITINSTQCGGGIVGEVYYTSTTATSTVEKCWSSMNINAPRCVGGIVGRACGNGNATTQTTKPGWYTASPKLIEVKNCVYWGSKIDVNKAGIGNGSSGSIMGYTSLNNVVANCWRRPDSEFTFVNTTNPRNYPADQPDGCSGWVKGTTPQVGLGTKNNDQYLFPYWGKATASGATVSSTVTGKSLGWDTTIWKLDNADGFPTLKNNLEPAE